MQNKNELSVFDVNLKCVHGSCLGIVLEYIFGIGPSYLPTFTTEFIALDQISALEVKLEKVDSLISKIRSLKLELETGLPASCAAFRNWTDKTNSDRTSKKRIAEGNENLFSDKEPQERIPKVFKTGTNIYHQTAVSAIIRQPKRRHLFIGRLSNSVSTDDIIDYCKKKGVDILFS